MTLPICILFSNLCMKKSYEYAMLLLKGTVSVLCSFIEVSEGLCSACLREMPKLLFLLTVELSCFMEVNDWKELSYFPFLQYRLNSMPRGLVCC